MQDADFCVWPFSIDQIRVTLWLGKTRYSTWICLKHDDPNGPRSQTKDREASHSIGLSNIHHRQGKTILKVCQVSILFWSVTGIQWRLAAANQFCVCFLAQFPHMQSIVFDSSIQPKYFLTKHNAEISTGMVPIGVMFSISKSACKHHKCLLGSDYDLLSSFIFVSGPLGLIKLTKYLLMISFLSHTAWCM